MHLLISGDSFGEDHTPLFPGDVSTPLGLSFGQLIAKKLDAHISFSAAAGFNISNSVMRSVYHIMHATTPVTHVIINLPEFFRSNVRDTSLCKDLIACDDFLEREFNIVKSFGSIFNQITQSDMDLLGEITTNTISNTQQAQIIPLLDYFCHLSTLSVLEQYCKQLDIKIMVTHIASNGRALRSLRNQEFVTYKHLILVDEDIHIAIDGSISLDQRLGNHLFPHEHNHLAHNLLHAYPDFFEPRTRS